LPLFIYLMIFIRWAQRVPIKVHIMVAHTSKVTEIMSDRCAGVCNELIVHFMLYFIHGQTLRTGT
jgi:hypothetical protein